MATKKKAWADIEDDEEEDQLHQKKITSDNVAMTVEYKLQPTGEVVGSHSHSKEKKHYEKKPIKKPLLSTEEMLEQLEEEKNKFIFIHCFGVNGTVNQFVDTFKSQVRFSNVIEHYNQDRDNSIDIKFDDKAEAIKFINLSQTSTIEGKRFRVKFGRNFKKQNQGENSKGGDYKQRGDGEQRRRHQRSEDNQEWKQVERREGRNKYQQQEKQVIIAQTTAVTENKTEQEQPSTSEPFKPFGFLNTKKHTLKELQQKETENTEAIHCVDTNAKVLERLKREEEQKLLEQQKEINSNTEQKQRQPSSNKGDKHHNHNNNGNKNEATDNKNQEKKRDSSKRQEKRNDKSRNSRSKEENKDTSNKNQKEQKVEEKKEASVNKRDKRNKTSSDKRTRTQPKIEYEPKNKKEQKPEEQSNTILDKPQNQDDNERSESKKRLKLPTASNQELEKQILDDQQWTTIKPKHEKKPQEKKEQKQDQQNREYKRQDKKKNERGDQKVLYVKKQTTTGNVEQTKGEGQVGSNPKTESNQAQKKSQIIYERKSEAEKVNNNSNKE